MVLNGESSSPLIAGNRENEISARGTDSQDDYVDHFTTAVSRSNIRTFTAEPLNGDVSPHFIASNREREISATATNTQAGYVDHFVTAVSRSNISTFTAQPLMYTAYAGPYCMYSTKR